MLLNFDANTVEPFEASATRFPLNDYPFKISGVTQKAVKGNNKSGFLEVTLLVMDGPYKGMTQKDRFHIYNESADAKKIAYQQLSSLCRATGRLQIQDDQQLVGGMGIALIGPQDDNDKYSEVKAYKDVHYRVNGMGEPQKFDGAAHAAAQPPQQESAPWNAPSGPPTTPPAPANSAPWGSGQAAVQAATAAAQTQQGATPPWAQGGVPAANEVPTQATMPPWAK